jgi:hypothetical protein
MIIRYNQVLSGDELTSMERQANIITNENPYYENEIYVNMWQK